MNNITIKLNPLKVASPRNGSEHRKKTNEIHNSAIGQRWIVKSVLFYYNRELLQSIYMNASLPCCFCDRSLICTEVRTMDLTAKTTTKKAKDEKIEYHLPANFFFIVFFFSFRFVLSPLGRALLCCCLFICCTWHVKTSKKSNADKRKKLWLNLCICTRCERCAHFRNVFRRFFSNSVGVGQPLRFTWSTAIKWWGFWRTWNSVAERQRQPLQHPQ